METTSLIDISENSQKQSETAFDYFRRCLKRLGLTQVEFAQTLGVSFQSVNRWERSKTKPLPIVLKQIEVMVREMGDRGTDLLIKYFPDERGICDHKGVEN